MNIKIIDRIEDFPQFEAQNVFQTKEWMRLFEGEDDTKVVLFAVYETRDTRSETRDLRHETRDVRCAIRGVENSKLLLLQPITIQRFVKWLPWRLGAYAVAWREPWRNLDVFDAEAQQAFILLSKAIEKYCKSRALYIEYRHFSSDNIYHSSLVTSHYKALPWYNIYREFEAKEDVIVAMKRDKRRQLKQSFEAGVEVVLEPTKEQIVEWYGVLKRLYRRIHRPLPSVDVFLKLNESGIGRVFVVMCKGRVVSGSAVLYYVGDQLFYDWYRASVDERIEGVYPSVVATWQALQLVADMGGGRFDFMGAGRRNKKYGVRQFKLEFGGELTLECRYRKYLLF